jgi:hypothetical protein
MDFTKGELRPTHVTKSVDLEENVTTDAARTSAGYQKTGDLITLPYTEVVLTEQPYASTIERVAPFMTATWKGVVEINPTQDNWMETEIAPQLIVNTEGNYDAVIAAIGNNMGTVWNGWQTSWSGTVQRDDGISPPPQIKKTPIIVFDDDMGGDMSPGDADGVGEGEAGDAGGGGGGGDCFVAGTLVRMADGTEKKIEYVKLGEILLGQDGSHNKVLEYDFVPLAGRPLIGINNSGPFMTPEQPMYTRDGWKAYRSADTIAALPWLKELMVGDLNVGDEMLNADNKWIKVKDLEVFDNEPEQTVHNFMLDGNNTYYADGFLAHNK